MAWAVVAGVIGGRAVREVLQAELPAHRLQGVEELLFAVEAAVGVVARVRVELDLTCRHLDQARVHRTRQGPSFGLLRLRVGRRAGQDRDCALPELVHRKPQQQRRVDTAGVGDEDRAEGTDDAACVFQSGRVERIELDHASSFGD